MQKKKERNRNTFGSSFQLFKSAFITPLTNMKAITKMFRRVNSLLRSEDSFTPTTIKTRSF